MKRLKTFDWWRALLLVFASVLRLYRLDILTEFLGDQGRTMLIMKDFLERGIVPFVGPLTLSGHYLGPVFYYLLIPGYLVTGGPIGVSVWMAILGILSVCMLYETVKSMFGIRQARIVTFLYAISPHIIFSDRVIWEPNLVPLFALVFMYMLVKAHREWKLWEWIALGGVVGILVQLHYPNLIFIGLVVLYLLGVLVLRIQSITGIIQAGMFFLLGGVVVLSPFLIYEYIHGFEDVAGVFGIIQSGGGVLGKRVMVEAFFEYAFRVAAQALPGMSRALAGLLLFGWGVFTYFRPTKKNIFLSVWIGVGLVAMARYSGVVHDHYLFFMTPVPFLMIASLLSVVNFNRWKYVIGAIVFGIFLLQLKQSDLFIAKNSDIWRVSSVVQTIKEETDGASFSFTLIKSRSFSDLHYRYYFRQMNIAPRPIADPDYSHLYLICDDDDCPGEQEVNARWETPILCYEAHCREFYPVIDMTKWAYVDDRPVAGPRGSHAWIYRFSRR